MSNRNTLAAVPPMGWNSYMCYGVTVREEEVMANARYMAEHLLPFGWQYVVVDGNWYDDTGPKQGETTWERSPRRLDEYGRLLPDRHKFPGAADGAGFRPLGDYIHNLGLQFGIHIWRGIPRGAVDGNCAIYGTAYRAREISNPNVTCGDRMYDLKIEHPGAQAYYDSLLELYASWGVDYVKADNIDAPYRPAHVEALSRAIARCNRPIVLSLSAEEEPDVCYPEHRKAHCELWRIGGDMPDSWSMVKKTFEFLPRWMEHSGPGHWPDADMLPLGMLKYRWWDAADANPHMTGLTHDEQVSMMTLWCIGRSPLMFAGNLPDNDEWTLQLITNPEVLAVNQRSSGNLEVFRRGGPTGECGRAAKEGYEDRVWTATAEDGRSRYVACFNLADEKTALLSIPFFELFLPAECLVRDLWARQDLGTMTETLSVELRPHGAGLYKISPV